jgi:DNA-binding NarL/FixJ family response regulator
MLKAKSITYYEFERRENRSIRTFLISDHKLLIDAFVDLTHGREDFSTVGSITEQGLSQTYFKKIPSEIDVFLIDSTMKEADAIQVTRKLKEELPESKIVILGLEHNEDIILRFVEAGAVGYVLKQASLDEMSGTITAIHNGQSPCSSRIAASLFNKMAQLARHQRKMTSLHRVSLTEREMEILRLMSVGLNNKDIARYLDIAFHTVKNHSHNILKKFQVHNRREAISAAYKRGIIDKSIHSTLGLLQLFILLSKCCIGVDINNLVNNFFNLC